MLIIKAPTTIRLARNKTFRLEVESDSPVTFDAGNNSFASVYADGLIKGSKAGMTMVSATNEDGDTAAVIVQVTA